MSNRLNGTRFEQELCKRFAEEGFWVHNMAQNAAGQPADIIAAKKNEVILIDAKDCRNNRFPLSRMEGNQIDAMSRFVETGNNWAFFALRMSSGTIYIVPFNELKNRNEKGYGDLTEKECRKYYHNLDKWFQWWEDGE